MHDDLDELVDDIAHAIDRLEVLHGVRPTIVAVSEATTDKLRLGIASHYDSRHKTVNDSVVVRTKISDVEIHFDHCCQDDEVIAVRVNGRQTDWRDGPKVHYRERPTAPEPVEPLEVERDETLYGAYDPSVGF